MSASRTAVESEVHAVASAARMLGNKNVDTAALHADGTVSHLQRDQRTRAGDWEGLARQLDTLADAVEADQAVQLVARIRAAAADARGISAPPGLKQSNGKPWEGEAHRYRSPRRPFTFLTGDLERWGVEWMYDAEQVGPWTADKIYTFGGALPDDAVERWGLVRVESGSDNTPR